MTIRVACDPSLDVQDEHPVLPQYQPAEGGDEGHLQALISDHPKVIYYSDDPDVDLFPAPRATITLSDENVASAEAVLDQFARSIQDGVTVWSAKGLLNHLLLDLDMEIVR